MPLISNFPEQNKLIAQPTIDIKSLPVRIRNYYKNVIKYLDEHLYFIYLKSSDPLYGLNFNTQLPYYIRVNVTVSIPVIIYQRAFPDDEDINPIVLQMITDNVEIGILQVTQNIRDVKAQLS